MGLTEKQERFARYYVEHGNKADAYRFAYNAENMKPESIYVNACKVSKNDKVLLRIDEIRKEVFEELNINTVTVAKAFKEIQERAMQKEAITDANGNPTGEWKFDGNVANRATENLAKIVGSYEKDNKQKIEKPLDLQKLTDDELEEYSRLNAKMKG